MFTTIAEIKRANREAGFYFFSPSAMRFFGSRVLPTVYGGRYFVTSEQPPHGPRAYAVRRIGADGDVTTIGRTCQHPTARRAKGAARLAAMLGDGPGPWLPRGELMCMPTTGDDP